MLLCSHDFTTLYLILFPKWLSNTTVFPLPFTCTKTKWHTCSWLASVNTTLVLHHFIHNLLYEWLCMGEINHMQWFECCKHSIPLHHFPIIITTFIGMALLYPLQWAGCHPHGGCWRGAGEYSELPRRALALGLPSGPHVSPPGCYCQSAVPLCAGKIQKKITARRSM